MLLDRVADIAVRTKQGWSSPVLSYRVPNHIEPIIDVGMPVWVPLRRDQVIGIVLAIREPDTGELPPPMVLRDVIDIVDPEVKIPPAGLALAQWMADYYRAPLWDALALFLPAGIDKETTSQLHVTDSGETTELAELPTSERGILFYLRRHGVTQERELAHVLKGTETEIRRATSALVDGGFLKRGMILPSGHARPRYEHVAWVTISAEFDWDRLGTRAPRRAAVLRELQQRAAMRCVTPEENATAVEPVRADGLPLAVLRALAAENLIALGRREVLRNPLSGEEIERDTPPELTGPQAQALVPLIEALDRRDSQVFLLHGVTGSGKTELYLRALARALRQGKQAVVLVPEIGLTAQLVRRFAARFGPTVAVLHSALSIGERYDTWRRLQRGAAGIVVGSRSAVFAPLPELGLVIVDEEHDSSYKHEAGVRYHAREVAMRLGALTGSPVVLGSATPAVESYHAAHEGRYQLLSLTERVTLGKDGRGSKVVALPPVTLVDLRVELHQGNYSMFSRSLQLALQQTLERHEQSLLFLNRRGFAACVLCRDCGFAVTCTHCSTPLVVHLREGFAGPLPEGTLLRCHTCNHREAPPAQCPRCWSRRIRHFGVGTQRVVEEVEALLPTARVVRWDRDVTTRKGSHEALLKAVQAHNVDIIVGTQMIAKGLDLPLVTLVGVVSADIGLQMPDFRAGERAFQLFAQVAGRAGRRDLGGQVIVQSYTPEHYALRAAARHDYEGFFREEIAFRATTGYPPFAQLARLVYSSTSATSAEGTAFEVTAAAERIIAERGIPGRVIGPAPAFAERIRDRFRWHLMVCAPDIHPILDGLGPLPGWAVDVDPQSLL
ncbi:MAG: primosomal protein N' [Herpetosiphon sp.]